MEKATLKRQMFQPSPEKRNLGRRPESELPAVPSTDIPKNREDVFKDSKMGSEEKVLELSVPPAYG